jgi:hypothetical protein
MSWYKFFSMENTEKVGSSDNAADLCSEGLRLENDNFACGLWVWNLVSDFKGGT